MRGGKKRAAQVHASEWPCFWLRGLIPRSWTQVPEPPEEAPLWRMGVLPSLPSIWAFGDASGGKESSDPRLRRIGWAYTTQSAPAEATRPRPPMQGRAAAGAYGGLPGSKQTINRGDLQALLQLANDFEGDIDYVTDSAYVCRGMERLATKRLPNSHKDLWRALRSLLRGRRVACHKVESHMDMARLHCLGAPFQWYLGNAEADALADLAANLVSLGLNHTRRVQAIDRMAFLIRARAVATLLHAAEVDPHTWAPRNARQAGPSLEAACRSSQHMAHGKGRSWSCGTCGQKVAMRKRKLLAWLATPCVAPSSCPFAPEVTRVQGPSAIQVGHQTIDRSHAVIRDKGLDLWACTTCGASGRERLEALARPCPGFLSRYGADALNRINKGLLPGASAAARAFNKDLLLGHGGARARQLAGRLGGAFKATAGLPGLPRPQEPPEQGGRRCLSAAPTRTPPQQGPRRAHSTGPRG